VEIESLLRKWRAGAGGDKQIKAKERRKDRIATRRKGDLIAKEKKKNRSIKEAVS
jgi:hypothetical protein